MFVSDNYCRYLSFNQMQNIPWIDKSLLYHWPPTASKAIPDETGDMSNMFSSLFGGMFGNLDNDESSEEENETEELEEEEEEDEEVSDEADQLVINWENDLISDESRV